MNSAVVTRQFVDLLRRSLDDRSFRRLVMAKPRSAGAGPNRVTVREVMVRDRVMLSFVESHPTKDITRNLPPDEALVLVGELIGASFLRAHLLAANENVDLSITKKGAAAMHRSKVVRADGDRATNAEADPDATGPTAKHDREKRRFVQRDRPYLVELGVTDPDARVLPTMAKKWKQINKFVEIVDGAIAASALNQAESVTVVDFGSGKGYLTFALHDHLHSSLGKNPTVSGVELRADLVDAANLVVHRTRTPGLSFRCGDISSDPAGTAVDIMVALHACDTATDLAIHRGITAGAEIIVCSPCCHKELRPQMRSPHALAPLLSYGVHLGLEADMVTDTLRALLLEAHGYDTKVFEFIGLEHSSKNKMILGVKRHGTKDSGEKRERAVHQVTGLKAFFGITSQHLDTLLAVPGERSGQR